MPKMTDEDITYSQALRTTFTRTPDDRAPMEELARYGRGEDVYAAVRDNIQDDKVLSHIMHGLYVQKVSTGNYPDKYDNITAAAKALADCDSTKNIYTDLKAGLLCLFASCETDQNFHHVFSAYSHNEKIGATVLKHLETNDSSMRHNMLTIARHFIAGDTTPEAWNEDKGKIITTVIEKGDLDDLKEVAQKYYQNENALSSAYQAARTATEEARKFTPIGEICIDRSERLTQLLAAKPNVTSGASTKPSPGKQP